jgi:hypothetical protein
MVSYKLSFSIPGIIFLIIAGLIFIVYLLPFVINPHKDSSGTIGIDILFIFFLFFGLIFSLLGYLIGESKDNKLKNKNLESSETIR